MVPHPSLKYLRREALPTAFCPGCGNGIVMNAMFAAFQELGIEKLDKFVFVSGIGCSSWIPSPYIDADTVHTLHGRAVAVATGIKLVKPELEVVVIAGDGDLAAIGGNHLLHAARRNMDLVVVMITNLVYAMTRGQMAPTTPHGMKTVTTPYGNPELPIDMVKLLLGTNANYIARWCVSQFEQLKRSFIDVFSRYRRGFRFIEVYTPCVTYVVRYEGKTPGQKLKELMRICVDWKRYESLPEEERRGLIPTGVFRAEDKPGFVDSYREYVSRCR